jgi:hypothetical protein
MTAMDDGIKGQIAEAERVAFENSAPLSLQQLKDLFTRLNVSAPCQHDYSGTVAFLTRETLDPAKVIPWLQEHGGHCDCEIIYNVYDHFGDLVGHHLDA